MRYLLLLYGDVEGEEALTAEERRAIVDAHRALGARLSERGVLVEAEALQTPAAVVRTNGGKRAVTDGPFTETKEQLGGYLLVDCESLDEAIEVAAQVPVAATGSVEIRPLA